MTSNDALAFLRERIGELEAEKSKLTSEVARLTAQLGSWVDNWTHTLCVDCGQTLPKDEWDAHFEVCTGNSHSKVRALKADVKRMEAELTEARKQPVKALPEITPEMLMDVPHMRSRATCDLRLAAIALTAVLRRHFRQAEPEAKQVPPVLGPPSDWQTNRGETIATLVARVQAETRREFGEAVRNWVAKHKSVGRAGVWIDDEDLFDEITRMERGE